MFEEARQPGITYVDNYVWLPKTAINAGIVRASLMYGDAPSEAVIDTTHVRVPRHFMQELPHPVVRRERYWRSFDLRAKTEMREYQIPAFLSMCSSGGGILNLGCGYGKTFIALNYIAARRLQAIVIVDKTNLLEQWKSEALTHLNVTEDQIGWVQGKRWDWVDKPIVLASLSTISRRARDGKLPEGFCEAFGVAIYDECHHLSASVFAKTCPLFFGERHGLTATPRREDGLEQVFINHLGPVHYSKVEQELIPDCVFLRTDVSAEEELLLDEGKRGADRVILDRSGEVNHRKLCAWLGRQESRNSMICHLADRLSGSGHHVLCVTHSVEHAEHLHELYAGSGLACGSVDADKRRDAIANASVSFATVDVAAEALNVPSLSAIIVMTPFGARSQGNLLQQALGRIQRRQENKNKPVAYFIWDQSIPMCGGLIRQVRRKLDTWNYPKEDIYVGDGRGGVAQTSELRRMRLIPNEKEGGVWDG